MSSRALSWPMASRTERSTCSFSVRASRLDESVSRNRSADSRASLRPPSRCEREWHRQIPALQAPHPILHDAPHPTPLLRTLSRSYMRAPLSVISDAVARRAARSLGRAENENPSAPCASPSSPAASASWHVLIALQKREHAICSGSARVPLRQC